MFLGKVVNGDAVRWLQWGDGRPLLVAGKDQAHKFYFARDVVGAWAKHNYSSVGSVWHLEVVDMEEVLPKEIRPGVGFVVKVSDEVGRDCWYLKPGDCKDSWVAGERWDAWIFDTEVDAHTASGAYERYWNTPPNKLPKRVYDVEQVGMNSNGFPVKTQRVTIQNQTDPSMNGKYVVSKPEYVGAYKAAEEFKFNPVVLEQAAFERALVELQSLRAENKELLVENAQLRRKVEKLERKK